MCFRYVLIPISFPGACNLKSAGENFCLATNDVSRIYAMISISAIYMN